MVLWQNRLKIYLHVVRDLIDSVSASSFLKRGHVLRYLVDHPLPRLPAGPGDVRRKKHLVAQAGGEKRVGARWWFLTQHIAGITGKLHGNQCGGDIDLADDSAAGEIEQHGAGLHPREGLGIDKLVSGAGEGAMQADKVALFQ